MTASRRFRRAFGLAALLPLLGGAPLVAQESPSEPLQSPSPQASPPAWRRQVELGFNGASGNRSFAVLRTGFTVTHLRRDVAELELSGLYRYGRSDGRVMARDWKTSAKLDWDPQARWSPFVFASAAGDAVRRLDLRSEGGAGAKYTFWSGERVTASLSLASLYAYEDYEQEPGRAQLPAEQSVRWSLRPRAETRLGGARLRHTTFYQPRWNQGSDFLVNAATTLTTPVLGALTLAVEHEYLHDSLPPEGVERGDHKFSVVFRYLF